MMENKNVILGALAGLLAYLTGLNWELIIIWFFLVCVDIITGVIYSAKNGEFESRKMKIGLLTKVGEFFLLFALVLIQRVAIINNINVPVASVFTGAFCFKEFASIFETATKSGIRVPPVVQNWFKIAHESINKKGDDNDV